MSKGFTLKKKTIKLKKEKIVIRSLTLDELAIAFEELKKNPILGTKATLGMGIVSPKSLKESPGAINAKFAMLLGAEILKLTISNYKPIFNPSKRGEE